MKIKKIFLKEEFNICNDEFSTKSNLLFSNDNSKGKTTYLRLLFYALGYTIPETFGIKFSNIECKLEIENFGNDYLLLRKPLSLEVICNNNTIIYNLPDEHNIFLMDIFKTNNLKLIKNLIGLIYIDQEKGWTLLNRGIVIGRIRFSIEEFVSGLSQIQIDDLLEKKDKYEFEIKKLNSLIEMNAVQEEISRNIDNVIVSSNEVDSLRQRISFQNSKINRIKKDIKDVNNVISENNQFFNWIEKMKITVKNNNDIEINVNRNTIISAEENIKFLEYQKNYLNYLLEQEIKLLNQYNIELDDYYKKNYNLFGYNLNESDEIKINSSISKIQIDMVSVNNLLSEYKEKLLVTKKAIKEKLSGNFEFMQKIYENVFKYCEALKIDDKIIKKKEFIFTDNLKCYSGTILHKLVISFKIAMHKMLEEKIGCSLPFILDSPSGREIKKETILQIMNLIKTELPNSQLIIASINDYIEADKIFKFKNYAIENHTVVSE